MAPTLYMVPSSPPVRAVLITAKALGIPLNEKIVDMKGGENLTPDYLQMNPQHTIPVFVDDDGFTLWDSHAINYYLITKYGGNSTLLPSEPKLRAVVEQRLHFDCGVLFNALKLAVMPIIKGQSKSVAEEDKQRIVDAYAFLESFLVGKQWAAGDALTVADYSLISTITSTNALVPVGKQYPNTVRWMAKVEKLPEYAASEPGIKLMRSNFANLMK